jgi:hypothetical protein
VYLFNFIELFSFSFFCEGLYFGCNDVKAKLGSAAVNGVYNIVYEGYGILPLYCNFNFDKGTLFSLAANYILLTFYAVGTLLVKFSSGVSMLPYHIFIFIVILFYFYFFIISLIS